MQLAKILVCALLVSACVADQMSSSRPLPIVGQNYTDAIQVGRATIPLPEGEWTVMAARANRSNTIDGSQAGPMASVILGRLRTSGGAKLIEGLIQIRTNRDTQNIRWTRDSSCFRDDWLYASNHYGSDQDQRCVYVRAWNTNFQYNENWAQEERDSVDWARANNVLLSQMTFLGTRYRIVKNTDLAIVWYYFENSKLGPLTAVNAWHPVARQQRPEYERAFQKHVEWTKAWEAKVIAGAEGRLVVTQPAASATPTISAPATPDRAARLRELDSLRSQGLLSPEEYTSRRQRILDGI